MQKLGTPSRRTESKSPLRGPPAVKLVEVAKPAGHTDYFRRTVGGLVGELFDDVAEVEGGVYGEIYICLPAPAAPRGGGGHPPLPKSRPRYPGQFGQPPP